MYDYLHKGKFMTTTEDSRSTLERALADPSAVFQSPDDVVRASHLNDEEKLRVLERWESDARLLQIATEENMGKDSDESGVLLQRVHDAMAGLGASPQAQPSPTKSG